MLSIRKVSPAIIAMGLLIPIAVSAKPAYAEQGSLSCAATTSGGFCIRYTQPNPGTSTGTPTTIPGHPPTTGNPGHHGTTITYKIPKNCASVWSTGQVSAYCEGSQSTASSNLNFWGSPNQTTKCVHVDNYQTGPTVSCSRTISFPGVPGIPPKNGLPPIAKSPYSGIPTALLAVFDNLNVPTPKIAGLIPSTNPYTYTLYPTQVSITPSSLPPTLTSSHTTTSTTQVDTTWNAQKNAWNTKPVTTSLTATITAHLVEYYWMPQAGTVNGYSNVKVPNNEIAGNTPGAVECPPSQNSLDMQLHNNRYNPQYCMVEFTQPSTKSGFYLRAYGMYSGSGTITENGQTVWSGYLGYRFSNVPASIQVPVAVLEAVNCTTANCVNAGLAPIQDQFVPYGPERP